jgi:hypothetical protein
MLVPFFDQMMKKETINSKKTSLRKKSPFCTSKDDKKEKRK